MENSVRKREWVKTAAIIFLAVLLVLTFFSQTILNRSLPEVSTASVSSDTINARIRGSGTVTAGDTYEVVLGETRTVEAVYVKVGDAVAVGDKLFLLADKDSTELTQAQEQLATARRNYQSALIDMGSADYARENRNIQKLRETLADAQQKLAAGTVTPEEVNLAAANLKEAQKTQKELAKAVTDAETAYSDAQAAVAALESQVKTLEDSVEKQDRALETLEDELYRLQRGETYTQADLVKAQNALAEAKRDYANCWDQNKTALDSLRAKAEAILGSSGGESGATSAEDVIRQMDEDQDSVVNNTPDTITTVTEELSQEDCAMLVGRCFAQATGSDLALVSLSTWIPGNPTDQNHHGVAAKLYAKGITDYDLSVILPTGWNRTIQTVALTGQQINDLLASGYDAYGNGKGYPYVLVSPVQPEAGKTYQVAICGVSDQLAAEATVTDSGVVGMDAAKAFFGGYTTISRADTAWN